MSCDDAITASAIHRLESFSTAPAARASVLVELVTNISRLQAELQARENAKSLHETPATEFRAGRTRGARPSFPAHSLASGSDRTASGTSGESQITSAQEPAPTRGSMYAFVTTSSTDSPAGSD